MRIIYLKGCTQKHLYKKGVYADALASPIQMWSDFHGKYSSSGVEHQHSSINGDTVHKFEAAVFEDW